MLFEFTLLFFIGLIVFPKFIIFGLPILLSDILLVFFLITVIFIQKKIKLNIVTYLFFILVSILLSSIYIVLDQNFNFIDFILGIKRFSYIFVALYISRLFYFHYPLEKFSKIISLFIFFGLVPLVFSLIEIVLFILYGWKINQVYLVDYDISSYDTSFLPVGFTGRATNLKDLFIVGSSSINYGIFNCLMGSISMIFWARNRGRVFLVSAFLYFLTAVLSRSSSVLLVMIMTTIYLSWTLRNARVFFVLTSIGILITFWDVDFYILKDFLSTLKSVSGENSGMYDSWELRVATFNRALGAFTYNPMLWIWGSGYGGAMASAMKSNDPLVESFVFETILGIGVISFTALLVLILGVNFNQRKVKELVHSDIQGMFRFIFPVLFVLNLVSGNIYGNEYLGFLIFFITGYYTRFV